MLKLLSLPVLALAIASSGAGELQLSARWLLLKQVALHIRGRLTMDGHPLSGRPIVLSASGRGRTKVLGRAETAADGSFGLHYRVVPLSDWRHPATRRAFEQRFRYVTATFRGTTRARVEVSLP